MNHYNVTKYALLFLIGIQSLAIANDETSAPFLSLFTTDHQRNDLDQKRAVYYKQIDPSQPSNIEPVIIQDVVITGMIIRADGTQVVWVNDEIIDNTSSSKNSSVKFQKNQTSITIKDSNQSKKLKPGQVWDKKTNKVIESYSYIPEPITDKKSITNESIEQDQAAQTQ